MKRTTTFIVVHFRYALAGLPTSWVPHVFFPPISIHEREREGAGPFTLTLYYPTGSCPHPLGKGRGMELS